MNKQIALKCIVKDCKNHKNEGGFAGDFCLPCYEFITTGKGKYSQMYRNTHPVKQLSDEEILDIKARLECMYGTLPPLEFARAIIKEITE